MNGQNLSGVLAGIPGLRGWQAQEQYRQQMQRGEQDLMQGAQTEELNRMKLAEVLNVRNEQKQVQDVLSRTNDPMQALPALLKLGTPTALAHAEKLKSLIPPKEKPEAIPDKIQIADKIIELESSGDPNNIAKAKILRQYAASGENAPYMEMPTAVVGPKGTPVYVTKKESIGKTPYYPNLDAAARGNVAAATETGKETAKRAINMAGLGDVLDEAEALLSGASGKALPTGSGLGTAYDVTAGVFGASPAGAEEAQRLKAIGGALTSKMPRMEGPQSDKDTQLYKEMAGVVGDSTIPRSRRIAALNTVRNLWGKYADINMQQTQGAGLKTPPTDADINATAIKYKMTPAQVRAKLGLPPK